MSEKPTPVTSSKLNRPGKPKEPPALHPAMYALLCIVIAVALFAPNDVLERWPLLKSYCQQMMAWFPFLGRHAHVSQYPQVTTLVKCLSLGFLVPMTALGLISLWRRHHIAFKLLRNGTTRPLPSWLEFGLIGFYVFGIWGIWLHPGDPSIARGLTTANRLGLAFVESAALLSLALVPGGIVASIRMRRRLAAEKLHIKLNRTKYK